ncbi:addiction module protein [Niveispirillum cyanobacteriorum]
MATLEFSYLTTEQRLDLITELCDSLDHDAVPLVSAQAAELESRLAMLNAQPGEGRDAFEALADLRRRHALCASALRRRPRPSWRIHWHGTAASARGWLPTFSMSSSASSSACATIRTSFPACGDDRFRCTCVAKAPEPVLSRAGKPSWTLRISMFTTYPDVPESQRRLRPLHSQNRSWYFHNKYYYAFSCRRKVKMSVLSKIEMSVSGSVLAGFGGCYGLADDERSGCAAC